MLGALDETCIISASCVKEGVEWRADSLYWKWEHVEGVILRQEGCKSNENKDWDSYAIMTLQIIGEISIV